ncbi:lysozyme [Brevundimonas naejangsanensis]|uniref:lysozyme n=3 Tax=Brevundimonas naejangsanensis TaxID=588932 RepID=UPI0026E92315|nr:lysozyme [Brevundimonas naejangsanensis]
MLRPAQGENARFELGQSVSAAAPQRRKVSREGLLLIKSFEGFRPRTVLRRDGTPVIGYGHSRSARPGAVVSEAEAELLLQYDLMPIVALLNERVRLPLNQHQFDALASFIFSIGLERFQTSDVLEKLDADALPEAADALSAWPERASPPVDALYRRRSAERALFDTAPDQPAPLDALLTAPVRGPGAEAAASDAPPPSVPVLRHEKRAAKDADGDAALGDKGAVLFIGGVGALAFAAGIAAFRRALNAPASGDATVVIGAGLAAAGLVFIGVAAWSFLRGKDLPPKHKQSR